LRKGQRFFTAFRVGASKGQAERRREGPKTTTTISFLGFGLGNALLLARKEGRWTPPEKERAHSSIADAEAIRAIAARSICSRRRSSSEGQRTMGDHKKVSNPWLASWKFGGRTECNIFLGLEKGGRVH